MAKVQTLGEMRVVPVRVAMPSILGLREDRLPFAWCSNGRIMPFGDSPGWVDDWLISVGI